MLLNPILRSKKGALPTIYSSSEFIEWQQALLLELQEIYDRMQDPYIGVLLIFLAMGLMDGGTNRPFILYLVSFVQSRITLVHIILPDFGTIIHVKRRRLTNKNH